MHSRLFPLSCLALLVLALQGCSCGTTCKPGELDCGCAEGTSCTAGLVCSSGNTCVAPVAAGVQISDAAARGCELLVAEAAGTEVVSVSFKNGARGTWIRQAPKVAISVVAGADTALAGSIDLGLTGASSGLTIAKSACVDVKGQRLASTVSIR